MSQTLIPTTAENGYWNSISGVYNGLQDILSSAYSSSAADSNYPFFFFHSDDATTGIPGTAVIDSVKFHYYIRSKIVPADYQELDWGIFVSTTGYSGATLVGASTNDYGNYDYVGQIGFSQQVTDLVTGWNVIDISSVGGVGYNRTTSGAGYTNIQVVMINVNTVAPEYCEVDIFGDDGSHTGNIAYLEVNWHLPSPKGASQAQLLMGK